MSEHTFESLNGMKVGELREMAKGMDHKAVDGFTKMKKEDLVKAICHALDIEDHVHHEVIGVDKSSTKARIRELKAERQKALDTHDHETLKKLRRQIRHHKHKLRKATS